MDDNNITNSENSTSSESTGYTSPRTYDAPSDTDSSPISQPANSTAFTDSSAETNSSPVFGSSDSGSSPSAFGNTGGNSAANHQASDSPLTTGSYSTPSAFSMSGESSSQGGTGTSHQEVFGGQVEPAVNSYYTNTDYNAQPEPVSNGFAIASLVMGILSIITCCCYFLSILFGILGIIFSCVQPKDSEGKKPTMATVGLILSIIGVVIGLSIIIFNVVLGFRGGYENILNQL